MVTTGYLFATLPEPAAVAARLRELAVQGELLGTVLVAPEGVNLSVYGASWALDAFEASVRALPLLEELVLRRSDDFGLRPFRRLKVQVRPEIVSLGRLQETLVHDGARLIPPGQWSAQLDDPEVTVIDLRNDYEVAAGSFPGSVDPGTEGFREFPEWVLAEMPDRDAPIAMFCTGGIRCAKAAAWMRGRGYMDVRELDGGVLGYLEATDAQSSRWQGECFVFDDRVSLVEGLARGDALICRGCRRLLSPQECEDSRFEQGVSCHHCHADLGADERLRRRERCRQVELAQARGAEHLAPHDDFETRREGRN